MTRESISRTRMTSSSVLFSIAMKHFLPRLGKNALTKSHFIGDKTGFILLQQTLAALQFALTREFKYLITTDDDFSLKMDVISKIDDNWFNLGFLSAVQRVQVKVDGLAQLLSFLKTVHFQPFFQKMDLESSVSHFPGPICYQRVGVRTSSRRANGHSDVGCQDGVVVEVSSQRKLFKNWNISVNLGSSRFLKKMSGSLVLQDCELDIPMKRW